MRPSFACFSKASRRPLTPKRGNKDYYKGTRQAFLPGGLRTGAPGKYFGLSNAAYKLVDEQVRYYVAPPIEQIQNSPLKPYVRMGTFFEGKELESQPFGKIPKGGLTPEVYLEYTQSLPKMSNRRREVKSV